MDFHDKYTAMTTVTVQRILICEVELTIMHVVSCYIEINEYLMNNVTGLHYLLRFTGSG